MKSKFTFQFFCIFSLFLAISCQDENVNTKPKISTKVSNVKNCETSVKSYEKDAIVNIYPIKDRFDYSFKSSFEKYTPDASGNYELQLNDGNYYFEVINKQGTEIINGTFETPEDLLPDGNLILKRVAKGGLVQERLSDGNFGKTIDSVEITHIHEITGEKFVTYSVDGHYCIDLNPGRYQVIAKHKDYITYDTQNGFNVFVLGDTNPTANIFLSKK